MATRRMRQVLRAAAYTSMIGAVVLFGQRTATADAGTIPVCVTMSGGDNQVAGLQVDLTWDGSCMTGVRAANAGCAPNSATGKVVSAGFPPRTQNTIRAILFSMSDPQGPIPDGPLFCCNFTPTAAQTNPCCSVNIGKLYMSPPGGGRQLSDSDLPGISVEAQVSGVTCAASVPQQQNKPVQPGVPVPPMAQPPVVSAPVVSAPAAPAGPASKPLAPVLPQPNVPAQVPPVQGLAAEAPTAGLAPTEGVPSPAVTPAAAKTPTAAKTAARTPTLPAATPPQGTPEAQGTATQAVTPATAAPTTAAPATTPTPKHKRKAHKERVD